MPSNTLPFTQSSLCLPSHDEIRRVRTQFDITQSTAAAMVRCSVNSWKRWEKGTHEMPSCYWDLFMKKISKEDYILSNDAATAKEIETARLSAGIDRAISAALLNVSVERFADWELGRRPMPLVYWESFKMSLRNYSKSIPPSNIFSRNPKISSPSTVFGHEICYASPVYLARDVVDKTLISRVIAVDLNNYYIEPYTARNRGGYGKIGARCMLTPISDAPVGAKKIYLAESADVIKIAKLKFSAQCENFKGELTRKFSSSTTRLKIDSDEIKFWRQVVKSAVLPMMVTRAGKDRLHEEFWDAKYVQLRSRDRGRKRKYEYIRVPNIVNGEPDNNYSPWMPVLESREWLESTLDAATQLGFGEYSLRLEEYIERWLGDYGIVYSEK